MNFIKAGFTGGFLGIVLSITDIFVNSRFLEKLSAVGLYVASYFGKVCVNTPEIQCSLAEKFTTIIATIVGNCIAYFVIFALISLAISIISMWFKPKPQEQQQTQQTPIQTAVIVQQEKPIKQNRPKSKAKVSKSKSN